MPWLVVAYLTLFVVFLVTNLLALLKCRAEAWFVAYEFFSGVFLLAMAAAYWAPAFGAHFGVASVAALAAVLAFDFVFTVWFDPRQVGVPIPELSGGEMEAAKAVSILFVAPAYIMCVLLAAQVVKGLIRCSASA